MKILIATQYYRPDQVGIAVYSNDFANYMAEQGHQVTVVTGFSFYPGWVKQKDDRGKLFRKEKFGTITCLRGYLYVPKKVKSVGRILNEISFSFFAFLNFIRAGKHDRIVIITPPASLGITGVFFKWIWSAKMIVHIQDIQSDAAISLGMVKKNAILPGLLRWAENFSLRHADRIIAISNGMKEQLSQRQISPDNISVYYNWIDVIKESQITPSINFREQHPHLQKKFIITYSGNQGIKQGLEILLQLAEMTAETEAIHYLIVGDGAVNKQLREQARGKKLQNVTFMPFLVDKESYISMLDATDVAFISQRSGTGNAFFPSKLLSILSRKKPLLVAADSDSETFHTVNNHHLGLVIPYGELELLKQAAVKLYKHPDLLDTFASNGFTWVKTHDRAETLAGLCKEITRL